MKRVLLLVAVFVLSVSLAAAKGWTGVLVDASCKIAKKDQPCPVTRDTEHYGIEISKNTVLELGEEGNLKVQAALVEQQKATGKYPEGAHIKVWVDGRRNGKMLDLQVIAFK